ncbi:MAG TPA: hypothetical protein VJT50_05355 [Pyrinomonadaceae bacterium]|nr:hypothetical protein [Pyrinomonadaceae bacterium]
MKAAVARDTIAVKSEVEFLGFALTDCVIEVESQVARYMRAVHRTALELAIPNRFGLEIGGFWLLSEQIAQLQKLPQCYSQYEAPLVQQAVEAYIGAQLPFKQ